MAWDQKILPDAFLTSALAAAAAAPGGEDAAFMAHIQSGISSSWKRQLLRNDTVVFEGTGSGLIPYSGRVFTVPGVTKSSITSADIDTGEWVHRIVNASDATKAISNLVTKTGGAGPGLLSGDLVSPNDVTWGTFTVIGPVLGSLSLTPLSPTGITDTTFTLRAEVAGSIPVGALMMIQWTDNELTGPWRESAKVPAVAGTFSALFTGATAGTVIYWRAFVFADPTPIYAQTANASFTTTGSGGGETPVNSLASAYATCMTVLNDFAPGNSAGDPSFENSVWRSTDEFPDRPYGAVTTPMRLGQDEPGVGFTDAGYIVTQRAASGRYGTSVALWPWFMPPKGELQALGNWRIQIRDVQAAGKIDSLTNPWILLLGPTQVPSYGNNNFGGLRVSGNVANYQGTNGFGTFLMDNNFIEARTEASGGISFKNIGTTLTETLFEPNIPDPALPLPVSMTSARCVAFAACFWTRLIPDTGPGPVPASVRMGALMGVDFYDSSGRVGTPGQGRLIQLTETWKPCVVAYVFNPATSSPRQPYSPSAVGTWLTANPPPFV